MNRNSKIALIALIAIGIAASAFYWLRVGEPVYQGKAASQWFGEINSNSTGSGVAHNDEAVQALVAMGDDAVPYLMEQYAIQHSRPREFLANALQKIPWSKIRPMSQSERHLRSYVPLMVMGPKAQQAVPDLLRLAEDKRFQRR